MRIQHNIMAMNAYRNYTNNTSALSKNLEKLSSGYKINRAGDDAAGLAISEKMRAQITGLEGAQKNAKDGISLVQTAEGALTEVHDMLNRMYSLAEQSANGTYEDETDRAQLQKEVVQLKTEIDRIADSANFNGIQLLDGSLSTEGTAAAGGTITADLSNLGLDLSLTAEDIKAVQGVYKTSDLLSTQGTGYADGDSFTMTVNFTDADGKDQSVEIKLILKEDTAGAVKDIYLDDGSKDGVKLTASLAADGTVDQDELAAAFAEALGKNDTIKSNFKVAAATNGLTFTSNVGGTGGAVLKGFTLSDDKAGTATSFATKVDTATKAADATKAYNLSKATIWDGDTDTLQDAVFEINGKKFVFINDGVDLSDDVLKSLNDAGVEHWVQTATNGTINGTDIATMVEKIKKETGLDVKQGSVANGAFTEGATTTDTKLIFGDNTKKAETVSGGLTLQIGDTSDSFNQLTVSINDCHAKALGIDGLDIGNQTDAQSALKTTTTCP